MFVELRAAPGGARDHAAVAAYAQWRSERDAVRAAYRVSSAAGAFGEPPAFETYQSPLDREERAIRSPCTPLASADPGRTLVGVEAGDQSRRPPARPPVAGGNH
jgi:hypothetical protein